jgi:hypothetical protein
MFDIPSTFDILKIKSVAKIAHACILCTKCSRINILLIVN